MCKIICNVIYSCGHTEPWVSPRACQFDADGTRKPLARDPLCLLYGRCLNFGRVRQVKITDSLLCTTCFVKRTNAREDLSPGQRERIVNFAERVAARHAQYAQNHIDEAERRSRLKNLSWAYIDEATDKALLRLDMAFADEEMEFHHFEELLQIAIGLPLVDKGKLVTKFASKVEEKFGPEEVNHFHQLSVNNRNFGDEFLEGLQNPTVV
ncbi:hypothetical protein NUW58_g4269 [Xylaria curta]|uniref:Uncharacterized protein n=1 Tax=Xylaria curta TaxID=42375 RepID=A0ACC1P8S9_9PEZI|nr:hypothetical protein NUW58_g4269 [Xylaria curta]